MRAISGFIESPASRPPEKGGAVAQIGGMADTAATAWREVFRAVGGLAIRHEQQKYTSSQ